MPNTVYCNLLNRNAEALERPPFPGELGERIHRHISKPGWQQWLEYQMKIINDHQLSTANPEHLALIEQHMRGYLFGEDDKADRPPDPAPRGDNM